MSGRGGGGGRNVRPTGVSVLANALGIQRGELMNQSVSQPPPLFPPLDSKPVPLTSSEDHNYMVALKNEFLNRMKESAYFLKEREPKAEVERYSDKYRKVAIEPWTPYYDRLPKELWPKQLLSSDAGTSTSHASKKRRIEGKVSAAFDKKMEDLEKREMQTKPPPEAAEEAKKKRAEDEDEEEGEKKDDEQEMSDEDYQEEDNDYIQNYFDNGENYLDESDDNIDDEACY